RGDAADGGRAADLCQADLPLADLSEERRDDDLVPESRRCLRGLSEGSRSARVAHALPRAGLPHRSRRRLRHDALRARRGAGGPQADAALHAPRDRNLHLGRPPRPSQDRRHRRLRDPRARVGEGTAHVNHRHMNQERVTVLVGREGRHLFETIRDPRIAVVSPGDGVETPDLVVLPCGQDRRFEQLSTMTMPETLRASVASGATGVVLDASPEAIPPKPDINNSLHDVIRKLGLSSRHCVYVTANWYFATDYLTYCKNAGIDDPVRVLHHD